MHVGTVRETKLEEYRVALTPDGVAEITQAGHEVLVETAAGVGSNYSDEQYREAGAEIIDAAVKASILRLRPILMTALSFAVGVIPLVIATGAGAVSRQSLGTVVFGGMVIATVLTLGLVPVFYVLLETMRTKLGFHKAKATTDESAG